MRVELTLESVMDMAQQLITLTQNPGRIIKYENEINSFIDRYGEFLLEYQDELETDAVSEVQLAFVKNQEQFLLREMKQTLESYLADEEAYNKV